MSESKPLTSDEIIEKAVDIVDIMGQDELLSNAEIVMLLDTAKMLQVQRIVMKVLEKKTL